jgi:hypothetical protein
MEDRQILQVILLIILVVLVFSLIRRFDTEPPAYANAPNYFIAPPKVNVAPKVTQPNQHPLLDRIQTAKRENRPIVWVYFEYEVSARNWLNFYSRRSPQKMSGILQLCLLTIQRHFPSRSFEVIVYTQDDIVDILPEKYATEYAHMRATDVLPYLYKAFVRYALLHTYGGYTIPLDTVIMRSMEPTLADYRSGKCLIYGPTSTIYREWYGLDDTRMAAEEGNRMIKEVIDYILEHSRKFHFAMEFRDAIFRKVQQLVVKYSGDIQVSECLPTVNSTGRPYRIEDLYATSWTMPDPTVPLASYCMIPIHYDITVRKYALGYLRRISKEEVWKSELWIAEQMRRSLQ